MRWTICYTARPEISNPVYCEHRKIFKPNLISSWARLCPFFWLTSYCKPQNNWFLCLHRKLMARERRKGENDLINKFCDFDLLTSLCSYVNIDLAIANVGFTLRTVEMSTQDAKVLSKFLMKCKNPFKCRLSYLIREYRVGGGKTEAIFFPFSQQVSSMNNFQSHSEKTKYMRENE